MKHKLKVIQCKDVDKVDILRSIDKIENLEGRWTLLWEIQADFPDIPPKVILAKLRQMLRAGWITGCGCGCRGDFEIVDMVDRRPSVKFFSFSKIPIKEKTIDLPDDGTLMSWIKSELRKMLFEEEMRGFKKKEDD